MKRCQKADDEEQAVAHGTVHRGEESESTCEAKNRVHGDDHGDQPEKAVNGRTACRCVSRRCVFPQDCCRSLRRRRNASIAPERIPGSPDRIRNCLKADPLGTRDNRHFTQRRACTYLEDAIQRPHGVLDALLAMRAGHADNSELPLRSTLCHGSPVVNGSWPSQWMADVKKI